MATEKIPKFNRRDLARKFAEQGFTKGVEVGVSIGHFSKILCEENPRLELKSIDPYTVVYNDSHTAKMGGLLQEQLYQQALKTLAPYNCEIIKKTSIEAVRDFPYESIDFVYIDGSHHFDYVMVDIIEWAKRVRKGGIVSGHDYTGSRWKDVQIAVDTYVRMHNVKELYLADERGAAWWFTKTW